MGKGKKKRKAAKAQVASEQIAVRLPIRFAAAAETSMLNHCKRSRKRELCGVLIGHATEENGVWAVEVVDALDGRLANEQSMQVTYTQETWNDFHERVDRRSDGARIVGWFHTHPGFGVFYSKHDRFIQESFFSAPWQFGVVVDPVDSTLGVFVNGEHGIETQAFYLVACETGTRRVFGRFARDSVRDSSEPGRPNGEPTGVDASQVLVLERLVALADRTARKQFWKGVISGVLLVLFFTASYFIVDWFRSSRRTDLNAVRPPTEKGQTAVSPPSREVEETKLSPTVQSKPAIHGEKEP